VDIVISIELRELNCAISTKDLRFPLLLETLLRVAHQEYHSPQTVIYHDSHVMHCGLVMSIIPEFGN
jgi:hypothetical protein